MGMIRHATCFDSARLAWPAAAVSDSQPQPTTLIRIRDRFVSSPAGMGTTGDSDASRLARAAKDQIMKIQAAQAAWAAEIEAQGLW
jgi:hypothetical protein